MKQKNRKRLITYSLIAAWLVGCYLIGQKTHPQTPTGSTEEAEMNINIAEADPTAISVAFINAQTVSADEIPWKCTAGIISLEDGSEAWLLTPGTGLQFETSEGMTVHSCIHPWMKETSDGAILRITYGESSEVLSIDKEWREIHVPKGVGPVRLDVLFSDNNDGDWVIIQ